MVKKVEVVTDYSEWEWLYVDGEFVRIEQNEGINHDVGITVEMISEAVGSDSMTMHLVEVVGRYDGDYSTLNSREGVTNE